jgi:hypothetical protein
VPVWSKNLENANKHLQQIQNDKTKSISDLVSRQEVNGKYYLFTASAIEIRPNDFQQKEIEDT